MCPADTINEHANHVGRWGGMAKFRLSTGTSTQKESKHNHAISTPLPVLTKVPWARNLSCSLNVNGNANVEYLYYGQRCLAGQEHWGENEGGGGSRRV